MAVFPLNTIFLRHSVDVMKVESVKLQLRSDRSDSENGGHDLTTTLTLAVVVVVVVELV